MAKANLSVTVSIFKAIRPLYQTIEDFIAQEREYFDALVTAGHFADIAAAFSINTHSEVPATTLTEKKAKRRGRSRNVTEVVSDTPTLIDENSYAEPRVFTVSKKGEIHGGRKYKTVKNIKLYDNIPDVINSEEFKNAMEPVVAKVHVSQKTLRKYFVVERTMYKNHRLDIFSTTRKLFSQYLRDNNLWEKEYNAHISIKPVK